MDASPAIRTVWENSYFNFTTQMVDATAAEIVRLVRDEAVPLSQIVVLAPFMSDTLRFSLASVWMPLESPRKPCAPPAAWWMNPRHAAC